MTGGGLNGQVIVVHATDGKLTLKIERAISAPMIEVSDSAGNSFVIVADAYEQATLEQRAQFYCAKATAIREEAARLN